MVDTDKGPETDNVPDNSLGVKNGISSTLTGWFGSKFKKAFGKTFGDKDKDKGFAREPISLKKWMSKDRHTRYANYGTKKSAVTPKTYEWRWQDPRLDTALRRLDSSRKNSQLVSMMNSASSTVSPLASSSPTATISKTKMDTDLRESDADMLQSLETV